MQGFGCNSTPSGGVKSTPTSPKPSQTVSAPETGKPAPASPQPSQTPTTGNVVGQVDQLTVSLKAGVYSLQLPPDIDVRLSEDGWNEFKSAVRNPKKSQMSWGIDGVKNGSSVTVSLQDSGEPPEEVMQIVLTDSKQEMYNWVDLDADGRRKLQEILLEQ